MYSVVRSFREKFVEGRFIILISTIFIIGMRVILYLKRGLPEVVNIADNLLWSPISFLFENPLISLTASTLSVLIISWLILIINNKFSLIRSRSNLPFITPFLLLSLHPYFMVMTGNYIAIIFILIAFIPLLESYQKEDSYLYSFRSSVLIAVASLFQVYAIILIPLWWRGERTMRGPQLRSFLATLFGVILVYITLFSVYILLDDIYTFLYPINCFIDISIPKITDYSIFEWATFIFILLYFSINMALSIKEFARDKVLTLNLMQFIIYIIIILLIGQVIFWEATNFYITLSVVLISFISSYFYSKTTSKSNIYLGYIMLFLMLLFYLLQYFPETFLIAYNPKTIFSFKLLLI